MTVARLEERQVQMFRLNFLLIRWLSSWSPSPIPVPRLSGGVGGRATPGGVAKQVQGLIFSPRPEHSGLLAGPSISVETFAEIYRPVPAGYGLREGKKCPF